MSGAREAALRELTGPGAEFELCEETWTVGPPGHEVAVKGRCFTRAPRTLRALYDRAFAEHATKTLLVYGQERVSYAELWARATALAVELRDGCGVRRGQRVAVAMRNLPEFLVAFLAVTALGGVATLLNAWWSARELAYALGDADPSCVIADPERAERMAPALAAAASPPTLIVARAPAEWTGALGRLRPLRFDEVLAAGYRRGSGLGPALCTPNDPAIIMYTAGTTGFPKGVVQPQRGVCTTICQLLLGAELKRRMRPPGAAPAQQECIIVSQPLFHISALYQKFLGALVCGRRFVMMHKWDPGEALALIERERATAIGGVPTMILDLVQHPDFSPARVATLTSVGVGGAAAPVALLKRVRRDFPSAEPLQAYGMTETNGEVSRIMGAELAAHPDSVGRPISYAEVTVVDPATLRPLPPGAEGELLVRGPTLLSHYWGRVKESLAAIVSVPGKGAGWLRTGDVAAVDEAGRIYIRGRVKDIIIRGGENISCAEVEAACYEAVPDVSEAAAFSLPHPRLGEVPGVALTLKAARPDTLAPGEIRRALLGHLAKFKVPEEGDIFVSRTPLPRGATDKILRRAVREQALAARAPPAKL